MKLKLKQCRGDVSLNELARRCELSVQYVQAIESGRKLPSLAVVELLCKALAVTDLNKILEISGDG